MLVEGRAAREIAAGGERRDLVGTVDEVSTLADLGVARDLASDAVALAAVPDDLWATWVEQASGDMSLASQRAFVRAARDSHPTSRALVASIIGTQHPRN